MLKKLYLAPAILWTIIILFLSLASLQEVPIPGIWNIDKLAHITVYAIMVVLYIYGIDKQLHLRNSRSSLKYFIVIGCFCFGLLIEVIQGGLIEGRFFDSYDILANGIGCMVGSLGLIFIT